MSSKNLSIVECITSDDGLEFLLPVVGTKAYLSAKAVRYGWFRDRNFLLPYIIERKAIFNRMVFTHETILTGSEDARSREKDFLESVVTAARKMGVDFIYQPHATAVFSAVPDGAASARFGSYIVDLALSEEALWQNVHSKHRNVIRKARDAGIVISDHPDNIETCYRLIAQTMRRNRKLHVTLSEMRRMRDSLGNNASFYVASLNGEPQGAAFLVWSEGHTAYYLHGGTSDQPYGGAMNLLHWRAMNDMKARGVRTYDFVGARISPDPESKLATIQRFKERFGATMRQGHLWKMSLRPWRYRAFQLVAYANALVHGTIYRGDIIDEENAGGR